MKIEQYQQKEIKPLFNEEGIIKIKVIRGNKETKWMNIPLEILVGLYNSFN